MKISVVTVCLNEEKTIERTIRSVLTQNSNDFEYIICDGCSTDATLGKANSYKEEFEKKGIEYKVFSEKDGGIYFGMNNAIKKVQGEYIIFINSGDVFHDSNVIKNTVAKMREKKADLFYGDIIYVERGYGWRLISDDTKLNTGMTVYHQGLFASAKVMKNRMFDTTYRLAADYDFILYAKYNGCTFENLDMIISDFQSGGFSETNSELRIKETVNTMTKHIPNADKEKFIKSQKKIDLSIKIKRAAPHFVWALFCLVAGRKKYEDKDI